MWATPEDDEVQVPASWSEVALMRFLKKCEAHMQANAEWRSDPRFHQHVDALQECLHSMESDYASRGPDLEDKVAHYKSSVHAIREQLEVASLPPYVEPLNEAFEARVQAARNQSKEPILNPLSGASRVLDTKHLDEDTRAQLAANELLQEALTDDMLAMARRLREQAEAQRAALGTQGQVLDTAAQGLLKSYDAVKKRRADARTAVQRNRGSIFFNIFLLFTVAGVFLGVYMFISVTAVTKHFVPYKTVASQWWDNTRKSAAAVASNRAPSRTGSWRLTTQPSMTDSANSDASSNTGFEAPTGPDNNHFASIESSNGAPDASHGPSVTANDLPLPADRDHTEL